MGDLKFISVRGLRDFAYEVLKSEIGTHTENGIIIPGKYTDEELRAFIVTGKQIGRAHV